MYVRPRPCADGLVAAAAGIGPGVELLDAAAGDGHLAVAAAGLDVVTSAFGAVFASSRQRRDWRAGAGQGSRGGAPEVCSRGGYGEVRPARAGLFAEVNRAADGGPVLASKPAAPEDRPVPTLP